VDIVRLRTKGHGVVVVVVVVVVVCTVVKAPHAERP
jgi:hypothetical protein